MAKERPSKRLRSDATDFPTEFSTNKPTVQQQAESFLAVTAEIPFSALTCQWRNGFNRRLQNKHVVGLCNAFESDSVRRGVEANFLLVQCGSDAIARMLEHLQSETRWDGDSKDAVCFSDWERINPNVKLEVMAGQHRIEALRRYVRRAGAREEDELWWTCKVYLAGKSQF